MKQMANLTHSYPPPIAIEIPEKLSWRFPRTFWIANCAELCERAAFYSMFIALDLYLSRRIGFSDIKAHAIAAPFSFFLYFLPPFMGAMADKLGFRRALLIAFTLLTTGYTLLGAFQYKATAILSLGLIAIVGAIVKPVISGTAAKSSDTAHRARAFSIFYMMINIGSFTGKTVAAPLRIELGLEYINFFAAGMTLMALIVVALLYRSIDAKGAGKSLAQVARGLLAVLRRGRFMCLIVIVAGFWIIQGQLYSTMPKYITRLLGDTAKPEWLANINPLVVILLVTPITHLVRRVKPENSIAIALFIIPMAALCVSLSDWVQDWAGNCVRLPGGLSLHPVTLMVIPGIALIGLAECFLSPKFLEYASKQAPEGQVAQYMGFQNLSSSIAWLFGFLLSGFLLDWYCPDPAKLSPADHAQWKAAIQSGGPMPDAYASAHYIWYAFCGLGLCAFVALMIFKFVTNRIDRHRLAAARAGST
ncbi:MAG TPA: MFS transporter [Phycisphaerae bacterium]|nr:MFS transporter [Phycisphaerae bacterium]